MATDDELVQQIRKGKSEAYGQLFSRYHQQIYSICFSILKDSHDAEDVTNETFIRAYLKLDQLKDGNKFFPWLKKIARNRSKNYARQTGPEMIPLNFATAPACDEDTLILVADGALRQSAPDEHLLKRELVDSIMEAIEALPNKEREVVRAHIDGLNHAEISERFSISISASMNRLSRARKKLAAHVRDLLYAIFGLPRMLPSKKIISGGMLAMKIGTSTKVTIGVIGVLLAGFIGFQTVTHQPDVKSSKVVTQQQTAKPAVRQSPVSKTSFRTNERDITIQDKQDLVESEQPVGEEPDFTNAELETSDADLEGVDSNGMESTADPSEPEIRDIEIYQVLAGFVRRVDEITDEEFRLCDELRQLSHHNPVEFERMRQISKRRDENQKDLRQILEEINRLIPGSVTFEPYSMTLHADYIASVLGKFPYRGE